MSADRSGCQVVGCMLAEIDWYVREHNRVKIGRRSGARGSGVKAFALKLEQCRRATLAHVLLEKLQAARVQADGDWEQLGVAEVSVWRERVREEQREQERAIFAEEPRELRPEAHHVDDRNQAVRRVRLHLRAEHVAERVHAMLHDPAPVHERRHVTKELELLRVEQQHRRVVDDGQ